MRGQKNKKISIYGLIILVIIIACVLLGNNAKAKKMEEEKIAEDKRVEALLEKEKEMAKLKVEEEKKKELDVSQKVAYLTFDDGPNKYTNGILDVLKEKEVQATFFLVGKNIGIHEETVRRTVHEGHYPGLHSVSHDKKKLYQGDAMQITYEMEELRKTVHDMTGFNSRLVRVPYGSKPHMKSEFRDGLASYWFKMWDWTTDSNDWKYKDKNSQYILENIKTQVKRDMEVVLMHDSKGTLEQLPAIIDYLKEQGYDIRAYDPEHHVSVNFWDDERL